MKFYALIFFVVSLLFSMSSVAQEASGKFALAGKSYIQRAILTYNGDEFPLTVYVVSDADTTTVTVDTQGGMFARAAVGKSGDFKFCESGAVFPVRLARKFVLRDLRAAHGMLDFIDAEVVRIQKKDGRIASVAFDDYCIEFSEYRNVSQWNCDVPFMTKISATDYTLELVFAAPILKK